MQTGDRHCQKFFLPIINIAIFIPVKHFIFETYPFLQHSPSDRVLFAAWLLRTGILQGRPEDGSPTARGAHGSPWMIFSRIEAHANLLLWA
jgi:hypothetical protein